MSNLEVLTVREVAELLRVSVQTVRRLVDRGELPAKRIGRRWRFSRAAIEAMVAGESTKRGAA